MAGQVWDEECEAGAVERNPPALHATAASEAQRKPQLETTARRIRIDGREGGG
jgi:hypothetical protein